MAVSTTIKQMIKTRIQNCDSVQSVYGYEEPNPSGFPAVFVKAGDLEGEFASNAENSRVYGFELLVLFPLGQDIEVPKEVERGEYAESVVADAVDDIINALDEDFELDGQPVLFANAADGTWGDFEYEGGIAKAFQMNVGVYTELVVT